MFLGNLSSKTKQNLSGRQTLRSLQRLLQKRKCQRHKAMKPLVSKSTPDFLHTRHLLKKLPLAKHKSFFRSHSQLWKLRWFGPRHIRKFEMVALCCASLPTKVLFSKQDFRPLSKICSILNKATDSILVHTQPTYIHTWRHWNSTLQASAAKNNWFSLLQAHHVKRLCSLTVLLLCTPTELSAMERQCSWPSLPMRFLSSHPAQPIKISQQHKIEK